MADFCDLQRSAVLWQEASYDNFTGEMHPTPLILLGTADGNRTHGPQLGKLGGTNHTGSFTDLDRRIVPAKSRRFRYGHPHPVRSTGSQLEHCPCRADASPATSVSRLVMTDYSCSRAQSELIAIALSGRQRRRAYAASAAVPYADSRPRPFRRVSR